MSPSVDWYWRGWARVQPWMIEATTPRPHMGPIHDTPTMRQVNECLRKRFMQQLIDPELDIL